MKTIAIVNQKGGVGKTTCAVNIAAGLVSLGKRVMLIDLDPQAHSTYGLGIPAHELEATVYHVLLGKAALRDIILERSGLWIVPSSLDLSGVDIELAGVPGREFILREAIHKAELDLDAVFIDCAPNLGLLTLNALTVSNEVYIPITTEFLPLHGVGKLSETLDLVRSRLNPGLIVGGVIATRYDGRKILNREISEKIKDFFGDKFFKTPIRENVALAEAPSFGSSIFEYKPDSTGAQDYADLCREITERL